jgi:hypothetical protein
MSQMDTDTSFLTSMNKMPRNKKDEHYDIIELILLSWLDKSLHFRAFRPSPFAKTASALFD